jgi:hypothetical protein
MELWAEYEAGETKEAVFVKDGAPSKSSTTWTYGTNLGPH